MRMLAARRMASASASASKSSAADALLLLPSLRRAPDELGVVAGTVELVTRRHGNERVGFYRAAEGGGFDSTAIVRERFRGVPTRNGLSKSQLEKALAGKIDDMIDMVVENYRQFRSEANVDFAVIEGIWSPGHSYGYIQDVNSQLAMRLGAKVLANVLGKHESNSTVASISADVTRELKRRLIEVSGLVVVGGKGRGMSEYLKKQNVSCVGVIPNDRLVSTPSIHDIAEQLNADVLAGSRHLENPADLRRVAIAVGFAVDDALPDIHPIPKSDLLRKIREDGGFVEIDEFAKSLGTAHELLSALDVDLDGYIREEDVLDFSQTSLVLCTSDRVDVVTSVLLSNLSSTVESRVSGLLVCGGDNYNAVRDAVSVASEAIVSSVQDNGKGSVLPVLAVKTDLFRTVKALRKVEPRISLRCNNKIERTVSNFQHFVDSQALLQGLKAPRSKIVTPSMFQHEFVQRAASMERHIVLPEGAEPRIQEAASNLLRHHVARITLLGNEKEIHSVASAGGYNLEGANIIDPADNEYMERYVEEFVRLRQHKGGTEEVARDVLMDVNYFGTMMVQCNDADGMVSGSVHTTAATVRPALQLVKTLPGISIVSSVFFMCLPDKVLVYGDCAINPNPSAEELAQIAVTSAKTAEKFGVPPRVALLSFSSGDQDSEPDVKKVTDALHRARELNPKLDIYGPVQYDAAVDESIARGKGVGMDGPANILIFPDLNTGNIGYKAVQQSTGATAVGPVLQGLRKPINDLSRGAKVVDIYNTVAITACMCE